MENGEIPHGGMAKIERKLAVSGAASTRSAGSVQTLDVCSKKKGVSKEYLKLYDRDQLTDETFALEHWKR